MSITEVEVEIKTIILDVEKPENHSIYRRTNRRSNYYDEDYWEDSRNKEQFIKHTKTFPSRLPNIMIPMRSNEGSHSLYSGDLQEAVMINFLQSVISLTPHPVLKM